MKKLDSYLKKLKKNPIFVGSFKNIDDVFSQFGEPLNPDVVICYANYRQEDYEGSATVFFYDKKIKKYYEVYGSHCSCMGLEDQWKPEEINFKELENRLEKGYLYDGGEFKEAFLDS